MSVASIWDKKPPVTYGFTVSHHPANGVSVFAHDISDSPQSQASALWALAEAAKHQMTGAQIHAAMLARIDALMGASEGEELAELIALAEACQSYERRVFP